MKNILVIFALFTSCSISFAQTEIDYRCSISTEQNEVFFQIVIRAGSICQGIQIQRSIDGYLFEDVGEISGTCGSSDSDVPYSFTDYNPIKNKKSYYRLQFGGNGFSAVKEVFLIALPSGGYKVVPNSSTSTVTIYFENASRSSYSLKIYDMLGNVVQSNYTTNADFIEFPIRDLVRGPYMFDLQSGKNRVSGKFIVQ